MLDCVIYTASVLPRPTHNLCTLIPDTLTVNATIEEMFLGFLLQAAECTEGGSNEASLPEIIPRESPVVHY